MPLRYGILDPEQKAYYIGQAIDYMKKQYPTESTFKRSKQFFIDEITFIERFGFSDVVAYRDAERIGRASANIKRENRRWIFATYEKYIDLRQESGQRYDWDDLAFYAYAELKKDKTQRRYTHIIVDEGQDFSPMMIKSLVSAVKDGGSFTFFGDVAQQIYGSRLSWRDSGINSEKVWRLDVNYRNPAAIRALASDITRSNYWRHDNDMVMSTTGIAEGPKPILVHFKSEVNEMSWGAMRAISTSTTSSTVIVCRNRVDINSFMKVLRTKGCNATEINKNTPGYAHVKTVYLTTFHAAKGLEFDNVFVPFLSEDKFPDPEIVATAVSNDEACADEIKLLYVAVTHSKYGLYMSYNGVLSPLFPRDPQNYDAYREKDL